MGYRRNKTAGTWVFRKADGSGGMNTKAIGIADDYVEADGESVLSYWQAVDKVRELGKSASGSAPGSITVQEAFDNYLPTLDAKNSRSARTTKGRVNKHILPRLGAFRVSKTKLYEEIAQKNLLAKKSGVRTLILESDLDQFLRRLPGV